MREEDKLITIGVFIGMIIGCLLGAALGVAIERSSGGLVTMREEAIKHGAAEWRIIDGRGNVEWKWIDRTKPEWP